MRNLSILEETELRYSYSYYTIWGCQIQLYSRDQRLAAVYSQADYLGLGDGDWKSALLNKSSRGL